MVDRRDETGGDGVGYARKDDRDRLCLLLDGNGRRDSGSHDDVGLRADQFLCERRYPIDAIAVQPKVDPHVAAIGPTQARKRLNERGDGILLRGIFVARNEHAYARYAVALLCPRHYRPRRRAPEPCNELPPPHPSSPEAALLIAYRSRGRMSGLEVEVLPIFFLQRGRPLLADIVAKVFLDC
jgi:hypothetical protein